MRRREFIAGLGGAAAWPLVVRAQQPERMRQIGLLSGADEASNRVALAAFLQALKQLGWIEGRNIRIDNRWGAGDANTLRKYAAAFAALAPDVILAIGAAAAPMLQATRTVPIVFVLVPDPVGAGFVESLARPGGNATGFMQFEYNLSGKWLELLKEIAPSVTRAAVLDLVINLKTAKAIGLDLPPTLLARADEVIE